MAKCLLQAGVDIDFNSARYGTALCAALSRSPESCDYRRMIEFLLIKGATAAIAGPSGNAIDVAMSIRIRCTSAHSGEVDMTLNLIRKLAPRSWTSYLKSWDAVGWHERK